MPRLPGQIDPGKTEAILEAAGEVFTARGLSASLDEVARKAKVSKQTIYNRYGSKSDLIRAMIARRVTFISAPLHEDAAGAPVEAVLARYAAALLESVVFSRALAMMRVTIQAAGHMPDLARTVFESGPRATRDELAVFLAAESARGRLAVDNPSQAAEFFAGMVISSNQMAALMGAPLKLTLSTMGPLCREAAARFVRAYAPVESASAAGGLLGQADDMEAGVDMDHLAGGRTAKVR
jgi:TetR/AcrR family transcriptional repressor of mexJK operon